MKHHRRVARDLCATAPPAVSRRFHVHVCTLGGNIDVRVVGVLGG
jgi:hypothetical protein